MIGNLLLYHLHEALKWNHLDTGYQM